MSNGGRVQTTVTLTEAIQRVTAAGWRGVMIWEMPFRQEVKGRFMGCLVSAYTTEADHTTNLWEYTETAEEAIEQLVAKAENL